MSTLLASKLRVPPVRPSLVERPRLLTRLDAALTHPLTLVSAPPGFGKTTLLAEWIHTRHVPCAWLSLDERDDDAALFWNYVLAALERERADLTADARALLSLPQPPPLEILLAELLNALQENQLPLVLVLDDYHFVNSQVIHESLAFFMDRMPASVHVVIATRSDPPLSLARRRVRGQLNELRAADLRFTADEAASFMNRTMQLSLNAAQVELLEARTEGWIAALQLAALSMQGRADLNSFLDAFAGSHHYVVDYLAEEILQRQTPELQNFLLRTSILDRMCAGLCDAVCERNDSFALLDALEKRNLFVVRLDDAREWFRYHRLFADFLTSRLNHALPEAVHALHQRASDWLAQNEFFPEAIEHAFAANDFGRAAHVIRAVAPEMVERGEIAQLRQWIQALPDAMVQADAALSTAYAWALFLTGQFDAALERLADAERALNLDDTLRGEIALLHSTIASAQGDLPRTITYGNAALEFLSSDRSAERGLVSMNLGVAYLLAGEMNLARRALADAVVSSRGAGNEHVALTAARRLGQLEWMQGNGLRAEEIYRTQAQAAETRHALPMDAYAQLGLGEIAYERNDLARAEHHAQTALALGQRGEIMEVFTIGYDTLVKIYFARGDTSGAFVMLDMAVERAQNSQHTRPVLEHFAALRAALELRRGNVTAAARWADAIAPNISPVPQPNEADTRLVLAQTYHAQEREREALALLNSLETVLRASEWKLFLARTLALKALVLRSLDTPASQRALAEALQFAQPAQLVRSFVDLGADMRQVLETWQPANVKTDDRKYASHLAAAFDAYKDSAPPTLIQPKKTETLPEPLSPRELQILRLIADGNSNQEIADKLVVSLATVKTHINNLYGKLAVKTRTQALARARQLNLL